MLAPVNYRRGRRRLVVVLIGALSLPVAGCDNKKYEVVERWDKEVPNFRGSGTHTEVHYVLLHDGHRIYASCDFATFSSSDPGNTCAFRPLRQYQCVLGSDSVSHGDGWDLKCKDADGHNVYLFVTKKD
jgi:hypothetical protein